MSKRKSTPASRREKAAHKKIKERGAVDFSFLKEERPPGKRPGTRKHGRSH